MLVVVALAFAAVGCGTDAADLTSTAAPGAVPVSGPSQPARSIRAADDGSALLVDDGTELRVLDPATAAVRFAATGGVASGDGAVVVSARPTGDESAVVARAVADGSTRWSTVVAGSVAVAGVSQGGETVALVDTRAAPGTTSFVVVRFDFARDPFHGDTRLLQPDSVAKAPLPSAQRIDLAGRLEFDGFSDTTGGIFVLQRSTSDVDAYKVRWLDLSTGTVFDMTTRDKTVPQGEMYGRLRSSVRVAERGEIATLYTVEGSGSSGAAFVHLLNTRGSYADCLDLPAPLGRGVPSTLAIAATASGSPLLVYDSAAGMVASLDPDMIGSITTVALEPDLADGQPAAIAGGDDNIIYLANGGVIVAYDLSAQELRRWSTDGEVTGLAVLPGTGRVAAIIDGAVRIFDPDGRPVAAALEVAAAPASSAPASSPPAPTTLPAPAATVPTIAPPPLAPTTTMGATSSTMSLSDPSGPTDEDDPADAPRSAGTVAGTGSHQGPAS